MKVPRGGGAVLGGTRESVAQTLRGYAALGYALLPCGADKLPARELVPHGLRDATTDAATLTNWLATHMGPWGLLPPAGVLVLDADATDAAERLERDYPELHTAPCCRTPRPGAHYYLRWPEDVPPPPTRSGVLPNIDIRGLGNAYLLVPPSRTDRGVYVWERPLCPPAALPTASDALVAALVAALTPARAAPTRAPRQPLTLRTTPGSAYARAALQREHDAVAAAPEGTRNDTLNRAAFALGQLVAGGALERSEVEDALMGAAATCGLPHAEAARTLTSGLAAGGLEPRTVPDPPTARPAPAGDSRQQPRPDDLDPAPPSGQAQRRAVTVKLSDVEAEDVNWLWHPYIPLGKITLLEGDPGLGKTWLALNLAAILTRGDPFPNEAGIPRGQREPVNVLYLSAEDGLADTLRPRLDAVGADVRRVIALTGWQATDDNGEPIEGAVTLADKAVLEQALDEHRPGLMVVDPLQAYLGASVDMHRANETRPLLALLGQLAERYRCAVLAIRHLSKTPQGRAIYRGLGSIDFAAAARSILLVGGHPEDDTRRVIAHVKSSLAEQGQSLSFEIYNGQFLWTGPAEVTAEQLLAPRQSEAERSALEEARLFLEDLLADGPAPSKEVKKHAKTAGLAWITVERAKRSLGVEVRREGLPGRRGGGRWLWVLDRQRDRVNPDRPTQTNDGLNRQAISTVPDAKTLTPSCKADDGLNQPAPGRENRPVIKTVNVVSAPLADNEEIEI